MQNKEIFIVPERGVDPTPSLSKNTPLQIG